ncbi:MAG: tetratricopeptide repeat protein [Flavobacteriales bacterium]
MPSSRGDKVGWMTWFVCLFCIQCGTSEKPHASVTCAERLLSIEKSEAMAFRNETGDAMALQTLAKAYADFANACHDAPETPEMLFRRADILRGLGKHHEALALYRDVHDHFDRYEKRSVCAFLVAFIYDAELGDRSQAIKAYNEVLSIHPDTEASRWSALALKSLGEPVDEPADLGLELGL